MPKANLPTPDEGTQRAVRTAIRHKDWEEVFCLFHAWGVRGWKQRFCMENAVYETANTDEWCLVQNLHQPWKSKVSLETYKTACQRCLRLQYGYLGEQGGGFMTRRRPSVEEMLLEIYKIHRDKDRLFESRDRYFYFSWGSTTLERFKSRILCRPPMLVRDVCESKLGNDLRTFRHDGIVLMNYTLASMAMFGLEPFAVGLSEIEGALDTLRDLSSHLECIRRSEESEYLRDVCLLAVHTLQRTRSSILETDNAMGG